MLIFTFPYLSSPYSTPCHNIPCNSISIYLFASAVLLMRNKPFISKHNLYPSVASVRHPQWWGQVQVHHVSVGYRESRAEQLGHTKNSTMKTFMVKREVGSGSWERLCLLPPWDVFKPCLEKSPEEPGLVPELILL